MKRGAIFINTARAEVVDEAALLEAVKAGRIRVGIDVFNDEPEGKTGVFEMNSADSTASTVRITSALRRPRLKMRWRRKRFAFSSYT